MMSKHQHADCPVFPANSTLCWVSSPDSSHTSSDTHVCWSESTSDGQTHRSALDAWGRVIGVYDGDGTPLTESAVGNHYLWQGRWYSWNTGLYYFRARWYDPITGRWLSKDPIGISGGLNQYVAFGNNPVNFTDPYGLFIYEGWEAIGTAGYDRGGFLGRAQANLAAGVIATLDVLGGSGVRKTAQLSGSAAGVGRYGHAAVWGGASLGLIAMNAATFGRGGSAIANLRTYASNPAMYARGSMTVPTHLWRAISGYTPIQRGVLLSGMPWYRRALLGLSAGPGARLAALWAGPTTGGLVGSLGVNAALYHDPGVMDFFQEGYDAMAGADDCK
jgi:RHS repeat-associated protein